MQECYMGSITGDILTTGKEVSFDRKGTAKVERKGKKNPKPLVAWLLLQKATECAHINSGHPPSPIQLPVFFC